MNKSRNGGAIKRIYQASISEVTGENTMSPEVLAPKDDRINVRIPKSALLYKYLSGDNPHDDRPAWQRLDALFTLAEQNKEMYAIKFYDEFVVRMTVFYPDALEDLNKLRPLIIKHILKGNPLDESYYKMLLEL
jgi:hypothetical protein